MTSISELWIENAYGGMREISVLEPLPGLVGFTRVVSKRVQPSPLKPHPPSDKFIYQMLSLVECGVRVIYQSADI